MNDDNTPRPWEGHASPFEGLYQHFKAEIARLEAMMGMTKPVPVVEPALVPPEPPPVDPA